MSGHQSERNPVLWSDGCFRIEAEGGHLWVTEVLHSRRGDVPKRWRITFETAESARKFIGARLRESHDCLYHFPSESQAVVS